MTELCWLRATDGYGWASLTALYDRHARAPVAHERPLPASELRAQALHPPPHRSVYALLALRDDEAVGGSMLVVDRRRSKSAWLKFLVVDAEHRRQGIGSMLLDGVWQRAAASGRSSVQTRTRWPDPAAAAFTGRAGGRPGLIIEQNWCPTSSLDETELRSWLTLARERTGAYSLVAFDGVCPDQHLDAFAAVIPVMRTAPGGGESEDVRPSVEHVRENMAAHVRQGNESWTVCARHDASGRFVGYTELSLSHHRPWRATQGDTGVDPAHRERGIGRWLKAHTALRLLTEHPEAEYTETWNASANAAMLSINRAMGFRVVARWQEWVLDP